MAADNRKPDGDHADDDTEAERPAEPTVDVRADRRKRAVQRSKDRVPYA